MDGEPELLDSGRPDEEGALRRLRRAHPRVVAAPLVIAALAGAGWVAARELAGPDLQALAVAEVILLDLEAAPEAQEGGGAGAVLGRVVSFGVTAPGLEPGDGPWEVDALGLAGPGIVEADPDTPQTAEPSTEPLEPGRAVYRAVRVVVDCAAVPLPVDASAYGLRVAVTAGGTATGVLPLGRAANFWARAVDADCALAEAARTTRVVSLAGEVDPTRPIVDLRFLVENDGPHVIEIKVAVDDQSEVVGGLDLAPGSRQEVPMRITLDPCPATDPRWGLEGAWSWPLGVYAAVARILPDVREEPRFRRPELEFDEAAAQTLRGLLVEACAGQPSLVVAAPLEGARFDPVAQVLEGVVVVTPPADWSGLLSVGPVPARESGTSSDPLWQPTAFTGPGQTEPITVPVRYRVWRGEINCRGAGLWVTVDVQVRVAAGAVERAARLQVPVQIPWPTGADISALCVR